MAFTKILASIVIGLIMCFAMAANAEKEEFDKFDQYSRLNPADMEKMQEYATSPSFKEHVSSAFAQFDANADGHITMLEFKGLLESIGMGNMSEDEMHRIVSMADANNDGKIVSEEWMTMVTMKPM